MRKSRRSSDADRESFAKREGNPAELAADRQADTPSRTARKHESERLQKLGEGLLALRRDRLDELALPEKLHDAVLEAKRLTNFGAKRRQLQFIGKLMRGLDPDTLQTVINALESARGGRR